MAIGEGGVKEAELLECRVFLKPDTLKDTNMMQLFVFYKEEADQAILFHCPDNLGKVASIAAV